MLLWSVGRNPKENCLPGTLGQMATQGGRGREAILEEGAGAEVSNICKAQTRQQPHVKGRGQL